MQKQLQIYLQMISETRFGKRFNRQILGLKYPKELRTLLRTQGREKYHEASRNLDDPSTSDAGKPEKSHIFPVAHNGNIGRVHFRPKTEEHNK